MSSPRLSMESNMTSSSTRSNISSLPGLDSASQQPAAINADTYCDPFNRTNWNAPGSTQFKMTLNGSETSARARSEEPAGFAPTKKRAANCTCGANSDKTSRDDSNLLGGSSNSAADVKALIEQGKLQFEDPEVIEWLHREWSWST